MRYLDAIKQGKDRVRESMRILNESGSLSYPLLFLKFGKADFEPVGEENLYSVLEDRDKRAVVICDSEGNAKAITPWMEEEKTNQIVRSLVSLGIERYKGTLKMPR